MKNFQKLKGQNIVPYLLLTLLSFLFCYLFCLKYGIFGSKVDWISQHSVIPDYFRQQFYETKKLFPEFAANIGGGQNIYYFAYYGLFSPLFFPSYLLPFVKMSDYVMGMSFSCLVISVLLLYYWLRTKEFSVKICFFTALSFLLSGPVIYHSYSQIMFINYMPFLILGFLSVDHYFQETSFENIHHIRPFKRQFPLILSLYLLIMTSFYFSIGGMLVLVLYGIYRYMQVHELLRLLLSIRNFLIDGIYFLIPFIVSICLSGVLLVPTACALFGRSNTANSTATTLSLTNLLVPHIELSGFFYSPYGLGLGTFLITVLIASLLYKKKCELFLAWSVFIILTFPAFLYLLNGGLYLRYKAFLPFLPLLCYMIACYLDRIEHLPKRSLTGYMPYILTIILVYLNHTQRHIEKYWKFLLVDAVIMLFMYCLANIRKNSLFLMVPMLVFLIVFNNTNSATKGKMERFDFYQKVTDSTLEKNISDILDQDTGYYRLSQLGTSDENAANLNRIWDIRQNISSVYSSSYNTFYQKFRQNTFGIEQPYRNYLMQSESRNPVFQRFMGEKYIISDQPVKGYTLYKDYGNYKVYQNILAAPTAYGTKELLSEDNYKKLGFPYNQTALLSYAVIKNPGTSSISDSTIFKDECHIQEITLTPERTLDFMHPTSDGYQIDLTKKQSLKLWFHTNKKQSTNTNILFVRFHVKNLHKNKDITIWIDGERNKLSAKNHVYYNNNTVFTYAIPITDDQDSVNVTFGKGSYKISQIEAYTGTLPGGELYQSVFQLNRSKSKGNVIAGSITMNNDGYFVTSISYEKSFQIQVDGKAVSSEKVNTAFLGCKLKEGTHDIKIIYHAPGLILGKCLSVFGLLLLLLLSISGTKVSFRNTHK